MSAIQDKVIALQDRIFKEEYYPSLWIKALAKHNVSVACIDQHEESDRTLILTVHDFWESLPDSPVIRTGPFFDVCNIAEKIFGDEE